MDLKLYSDKFHGGNVAFCCIGTTLSKVKKVIKNFLDTIVLNEISTIKKWSGYYFFQSEFEFIERDLIVDCATTLRKNGCKEFHLGIQNCKNLIKFLKI